MYDWATTGGHGYTFENVGVEGHGTNGTGETGVGTAATRATRPVTTINWQDAIVWCNAYSEMSGREPVYYTDTTYATVVKGAWGAEMKPGANGYRLPTEAEWEYAARGGDQSNATNWGYPYSGSNTIGDVAWYDVNSYNLGSSDDAYGAHPVGSKAANRKGLYDMSGNVYEWCWDWYDTITTTTPAEGAVSGMYRVLRGGGWYGSASYCTVASRSYYIPSSRGDSVGFRVVCP